MSFCYSKSHFNHQHIRHRENTLMCFAADWQIVKLPRFESPCSESPTAGSDVFISDQRAIRGMASTCVHSQPATQKREIERALRLWPASLEIAKKWSQGGASC